ncbi:MAG: hypothetical protein COW32_10985 [Candidatus Aquicultor secundus]|uniref:YtxH domain-containing protein n=1 Tax=Candidatus Aquicultor secundus TaxID=1973895 RepID=A0A2M7T8M0_9ACTN|nr:YtxH domain-containing protein [Candidatus Aquicultor secundus]NCO65906.1 YtxH domain-containing protein [Solirubrobacter sp.]OIO87634.1 MAG: hypothetical protein AUK32_03365 [Candidatus Aquicultor secundus]PIU27610.1 MAG: hypothetical protein COT10_02545 [Candidatus Aquicultor secundus]PIW21243.1 MAG: hypothetical protein COW32_10985 [Candidatus Aquicultor secundus]PIX51615.1 MAG: hypothetical protein COZ51_08645 [Candidatus Aquicultor secundus]
MSERRFGTAEFGLGLLLGLTTGAVVGILMAPQSGAKIRGGIADRAADIKSLVSDLLEQTKLGFEVAATQVEKIVGLQERNMRKKLDALKAQLDEYHLNEA